jgi:hypothetical protein
LSRIDSHNTIIGKDNHHKSLILISGGRGIDITSNYYSNYNGSGIYEIAAGDSDPMPLTTAPIEFSEISIMGDDLQYNLGQSGNEISFTSSHNTIYHLYRNGELIDTGVLKATETLTINANNLAVGINSFSMVVPTFFGKGSYVKTITVNVINPMTVPTVTETTKETSTITPTSDPTDEESVPTDTSFLGNQIFIVALIAIILLQITRMKRNLIRK